MARASFMALVVLVACAEAPRPEEVPSPYRITDANGEEAVLGIFCEPGWSLRPNEPPPGRTLVVAVWQDGRIVWSHDLRGGGLPYRLARLPEAETTSLRGRVCEAMGAFWGESHFGPDAGSTHVIARCGGQSVSVASWHELYERDGIVATQHGLVATEYGLEGLEPSSRYRDFREAWTEATDLLRGAIPERGEEIAVDGVAVSRSVQRR